MEAGAGPRTEERNCQEKKEEMVRVNQRETITGTIIGRRRVRSPTNRPRARRGMTRESLVIGRALGERRLESGPHRGTRVPDQGLGLGSMDPAAGDDLGICNEIAGVKVHGANDDDHSLFSEHPPVSQNSVTDVADGAVDIEVSRRNVSRDLEAVVAEHNYVAVLADEHLGRLDSHCLGQARRG